MTFRKFTITLLLVIFAFISLSSAQNMRGSASGTKCPAQGTVPEACPLYIDPVCGYRPDFVCILPSCQYQTYSNGCEACNDPLVVSYTQGPCPPMN